MRYSLACGDAMPGCPATFEADSVEELLQRVGPHAADAQEAVEGAIKQS